MNLFIESIEGGSYIAGTGETRADNFIKDKHSNSLSFQCINTIKEQVKGQKFEKIWLTQSTPYEEMCGLNSTNEPPVIELEWY
jgi:hypothetical protein